MENTLINKTKFFALYWFQKVFFTSEKQKIAHKNTFGRLINKKDFLLLKPLCKISDEDANEVGRIVFERPTANFEIRRKNDIMYLENIDKVGIKYFLSMLFDYATICSSLHIPDKDDVYKTYKHNIGEIHLSADRPLAYIMVVDYLRSKGYAIPYMGLSVKKQVEYGWIKLESTNIDYFEDEGWGVFYSNQSSKNGEYVDQVQRIDELGILASDVEAVEIARKKGFIVGTENNPFEVISYPNPLLRK